MENWTSFSTTFLNDNIIFHFTGCTPEKFSVVKVNHENLAVHGELYFLYSLKSWRSFVFCVEGCTTILQHYAHTHRMRKGDASTDVTEEILEHLILKSNNWPIKIARCMLQKERVCVFLNRRDIITNSIKMALDCGRTFGRKLSTGKAFSLKYQPDAESDLTTQRLHLILNVAAKVLHLQGHVVSDEGNSIGKYIFSSKSEGPVAEGYKKYICGVVKNSQSNSKEVCLSWQQYVEQKMNQVAESSKHELIGNKEAEENKRFLHNLASAIITFELIAVKPSRSVVIGNNNLEDNRNVTNTKGASFILYNTARISTIIAKYNEKVSREEYPSLPNIENVDFSQLQEEEGDHLIPKVIARLYMLHALQIVLQNALDIFDIKMESRM
ncbi:uncharacterized protein LOC105281063 isoform X2 [Ooceraea biroi]|uniref:uncharacterized protein LOC105281063 isoform X2 n=1 Tax=Ooceraea biroi TaxID=2015173 RepID=UPI0005BDBFF4|nr:uncharacterized protein LOC105281063 isoform X2 [Ooceraea biroi]